MSKIVINRFTSNKLSTNFLQAIPFWIASLLTGVIAVIYARLFAWAENWGATIFHIHGWMIFIITPCCFVLAWWIVKQFAPYASGSGIPQVMAAIELSASKENQQVDKLLNIRVLIVKVVSSLFMIVGGGAIGREGPTIQIAGVVFRKVNQWLPKTWPRISKKNMILTGAAAGLAAAFNTPLGGIVFAVEELAKTHISNFKTAIFTAVIISGLTAQAFLGPYLYLGYPTIVNPSNYVFFGVIVVAIASGLAGSIMGIIILKILRWKSALRHKHVDLIYVLICTLIISVIAYFGSQGILGSGKEEMATILFTAHRNTEWQTPFIRIFGPVMAFTTGASGGIFAPSLGAGATIGSFVAGIFNLSVSNENVLVLSGMVAFLTGVTRSPFTSAILVLEMTDRHSVIFSLMLAGIVASLVSTFVSKHSLYEYLKVDYLVKLHKEELAQVKDDAKAH